MSVAALYAILSNNPKMAVPESLTQACERFKFAVKSQFLYFGTLHKVCLVP